MKMESLSVEELSCPVCIEIFKFPVVLSCSHSFCKECLQKFWRSKKTRQCPVCRRRSSKTDPPSNLVLKNLCESFLNVEEVCNLHGEKLKLFCLEDSQSVCLVCRDSDKHAHHQFKPIKDVLPSYKEELCIALKSLQEKLKNMEEVKGECEEAVEHIQTQAQHTKHQIIEEFKKLHQFLIEEEEAKITALRDEEEQKTQMMKENLEEMNKQISALSDTIKDIEEEMKAKDVLFLNNFKATMERAQSPYPNPQMSSGALINVANHLGNLAFGVWLKMRDIVQNAPVNLDPNTAHPELHLSDDLTSLTWTMDTRAFPANPERFDIYPCVLGSEGFNSGTHCWDVEVGDNIHWTLGITTEANQRKGFTFFDKDVWCVWYKNKEYFSHHQEQTYTPFSVKERLRRVRVLLDWDRGKVSFSDPLTDTHLCSFTTTFTERIFPFFSSVCLTSGLKILPVKIFVTDKHSDSYI
ncbi:nuclear factor 7, brain-like [Megalobrama amblycephala]|uniref:nuclear factor 7, brain-like n=1 Tax=Megalobrama amblycephala TaxID=75352 RepID=UPI0020145BB5|nr:nuclear factor 7, brain-like [Megalobrama amblycephala]